MSWEGAGVMFRIAVVLICCSLGVSEMAGREDWLDPNDMLNFDPATKTMRNKPKVGPTFPSECMLHLGPVVQSVVSLLRVISLTVLVDSIYNILIFFADEM